MTQEAIDFTNVHQVAQEQRRMQASDNFGMASPPDGCPVCEEWHDEIIFEKLKKAYTDQTTGLLVTHVGTCPDTNAPLPCKWPSPEDVVKGEVARQQVAILSATVEDGVEVPAPEVLAQYRDQQNL